MYLFIAIVFFFLLFFFQGKDGFGVKADKDIDVPLNSNALVTQIIINPNVPVGTDDSWINLLDIDIRDTGTNRIDYGKNKNNVSFQGGSNWPGYPVEELWNNEYDLPIERRSMGHARPENPVDRLIIKLEGGVQVGFIQITNRWDCCWHRIGKYRLSIYNQDTLLGEVSLQELAFQGRTVRYKLNRPKPV
jgi:hypothetical protein